MVLRNNIGTSSAPCTSQSESILTLIQSTKLISISSSYTHSCVFSSVQFNQFVQICMTMTVKVQLRWLLTGTLLKSPFTKKKNHLVPLTGDILDTVAWKLGRGQ